MGALVVGEDIGEFHQSQPPPIRPPGINPAPFGHKSNSLTTMLTHTLLQAHRAGPICLGGEMERDTDEGGGREGHENDNMQRSRIMK